MRFVIALDGERLHVEADLASADDADAFADALNAARQRLWPIVEEAAAEDAEDAAAAAAPPKRRPIQVKPGSRAEAVLAQLRAGVTDPVAIADALDMDDRVARTFIAKLRNAGHWSAP